MTECLLPLRTSVFYPPWLLESRVLNTAKRLREIIREMKYVEDRTLRL